MQCTPSLNCRWVRMNDSMMMPKDTKYINVTKLIMLHYGKPRLWRPFFLYRLSRVLPYHDLSAQLEHSIVA